ncbi:zinc-ribbon domain-containing protein [Nocardia sp. GCM10030253]|uniref:zinc-ribbon domain-containing protein n=1 Tax=Nocardia sp. GCM10030253 TaxID=3273404 RepID=UPI00363BF7A4
MPDRRPPIPRPLRRALLVEAGHRCAITTCRSTPVDFAHIVPWSRVREHAFDNMIVLCPNCHRRFDQGEIDRESMRQYKRQLAALVSGRETASRVTAGAGRPRTVNTVNLAAAFPNLVAEWHPDRNKPLTPNDMQIGSARHVWWRCAYGHEWSTGIGYRVRSGTGCPICK